MSLVSLAVALLVSTFVSAAVTSTKDGVNTIYTYDYDPSLLTVSYDNSYNVHMTLTALGQVYRINGGCNYTEKDIVLNLNASNPGDNLINVYYSQSDLGLGGNTRNLGLQVRMQSNSYRISTQDDLKFKARINTIRSGSDQPIPKLYLYDYVTQESYELSGNVVELVNVFNVPNTNVSYYTYDIEYLLNVKTEGNLYFSFDYIYFTLPATLDLQYSLHEDESLYNRYRLSVSDIEVTVMANQSVLDYYNALSASNDDMKQFYSEVNSVDSSKIDSINTGYNKLDSVNSQLSNIESFENELKNDFDISDQPDVLSDSTMLGVVSDIWDILPLENSFFTTVFGMIGSIALLSLILHAGDRGVNIILGGSSSARSSRSERNKNSNNNKSG